MAVLTVDLREQNSAASKVDAKAEPTAGLKEDSKVAPKADCSVAHLVANLVLHLAE